MRYDFLLTLTIVDGTNDAIQNIPGKNAWINVYSI